MTLKILTDEAMLRRRCEPVKNVKEGLKIGRILVATLLTHNGWASKLAKVGEAFQHGIGLAAPQVGIQKQVCVIHLGNHSTILMNPRITRCSKDTLSINEGCLSFPSVTVDTWRHAWVEVTTMNMGTVTFGPRKLEEWNSAKLLESVVAQHEVGHLAGLLMHDFVNRESIIPATQWFTILEKPASCVTVQPESGVEIQTARQP